MTSAHPLESMDERITHALAELRSTITGQCPGAIFTLSHPEDEPTSVDLIAIVDVDDPDSVLELVVDRVVDMQTDEGLPIHVVAIRTPERMAADLERRRRLGRRVEHTLSVVDVVGPRGPDGSRS